MASETEEPMEWPETKDEYLSSDEAQAFMSDVGSIAASFLHHYKLQAGWSWRVADDAGILPTVLVTASFQENNSHDRLITATSRADQLETQRDEVRLELCVCASDAHPEDWATPEDFARDKGWSYLFEKESS